MANQAEISTVQLFAPPQETWTRLSPNYVMKRRIGAAIQWTLVGVFVVGFLQFFLSFFDSFAGDAPSNNVFNILFEVTKHPVIIPSLSVFFLALMIFRVARQGAIVRRWGFTERESDLYITSGVWYKRLTVVPYGRMQAVEVNAGPIERLFGIASVELVTASASSNAIIPGLTREQAVALRDRLTVLGEHQAAGL